MATISQIDANRQNAQFSTGPVTETGRAASSRNALTLGLYTRSDYVKPDERDIYKEFCETMYQELAPKGLLEQSLTAEITGATWRLRRCSAAEGELADYATQDPLLDDKTDKTRRSIERARAGAHSLLHRSINQLRRLQTDRLTRSELLSPNPVPSYAGIADYKHIVTALNTRQKAAASTESEADFTLADIEAFCAPPTLRYPQHLDPAPELASFCKPEEPQAETPAAEAPCAAKTPRNAPCPCRSGQKFKRCCGRNPGQALNMAA